MGKIYPAIDHPLAEWIKAQHVFFVATAPLAANGHINCSPKGGQSLRIIDPLTVIYQDLTGSGIETVAHIRENSRIVIMFCAFEGPPRIVRLHGQAEVLRADHSNFASLLKHFPVNLGTRAIIRVKVKRIADSCGMGVPLYRYQKDRDALDKWAQAKGRTQLQEYRKQKNTLSIDGLLGIAE